MEMQAFLRKILPGSGTYYIAIPSEFTTLEGKTVQYFKHIACPNQEKLANIANFLAFTKSDTVYYALANYKDPEPALDQNGDQILTGSGKPKMYKRVQRLAINAKSFWLDIDCGADKAKADKGYPTVTDAINATDAFAAEVGLPTPMYVHSGNGLHVYWPLSEEIPRIMWEKVANLLHAATMYASLLVDVSRTRDIASVLRPVGTANRKDPDNIKIVSLIQDAEASDPRVIVQALKAYKDKNKLTVATSPVLSGNVPQTTNRMADLEMPSIPSFGAIAATKCAQLAWVQDTHGVVDEPTWRGALGVLKFTEDGDALAHLWSDGHQEYSESDTNEKMHGWNGGPATCEYFEGHTPTMCEGCEFKGKVKSPIVLGREAPTQPTQIEIPIEAIERPNVAEPEQFEREVELTLPAGFVRTEAGGLAKAVLDADGIIEYKNFSNLTWFPGVRIRRDTGDYAYACTVIKAGVVRTFELEAISIAGQGLFDSLAAQEVFVPDTTMRRYMQQYVTAFCTDLVSTTKEVHTHNQFGWNEARDGFVLGTAQYNADGSIDPVVLDGNAKAKAAAFESLSADTAPWVEAVDWIYNRDNMVHLQYAVCNAFGATLGVFQNDSYAGIPLAITDPDSGKGKTTAAKIGLAAFGNWREMFISSSAGATKMARISTISAMNNLPVLIDELTNVDGAELVEFLYSASNGKERQRLTQGGQLRETSSWNTSVYITANEEFSTKLAAMGNDTEANQLRILEMSTKEYQTPVLDSVEVDLRVERALAAPGAAGVKFIKSVVQNKATVLKTMKAVRVKLGKKLPASRDPQWRFLRYHAECTITAAAILKKLSLINFDMDTLIDWTVTHLKSEMGKVEDNKADYTSTGEIASNVLSSLQGNGELLVTEGWGERGEIPKFPLNGEVHGRLVLASKNTGKYRNTLIVNRAYLKTWCGKRRISFSDLISQLHYKGMLTADNETLRLGSYSTIPTGTVRCVVIKVSSIMGELDIVPDQQKKGEDEAVS